MGCDGFKSKKIRAKFFCRCESFRSAAAPRGRRNGFRIGHRHWLGEKLHSSVAGVSLLPNYWPIRGLPQYLSIIADIASMARFRGDCIVGAKVK